MPGRTDRRFRMVALLVAFVLFGTVAALRLGYWQVVRGPELAAQAQMKFPRPAEVSSLRADIIDRHGAILAQTASLDRLVAYPELIPEDSREPVLEELARIMDVTLPEAQAAYGAALADDARYARLEPTLTPAQSLAVREAVARKDLIGVALEPTQVRIYAPGGDPRTTLASQLLGFVDAEGRGRYGVEQAIDARLSGAEAWTSPDLAMLGGGTGATGVTTAATSGDGDGSLLVEPVRLTIHADLQLQLEKELFAARTADHAKGVSGVILDPYTGEVLAWASLPAYDANDYLEVARHSLVSMRDPIVSDAYEPGSVMKVLTAASAIANGVVTPRTKVRDGLELPFYKHTVYNADHKSMGVISVKDAIAYSRNVATARIARRLGTTTDRAARRLYETWRQLGIGEKTGVDVAGESAGLAADPAVKEWAPVDLANRAFGQSVGVTLIQLARAFAAITNGGWLVTPHLALDGPAAHVPRERVLDAETTRQLRDIMEHVTGAVPWYAEGSLIRGYVVGGKTGTAQIYDPARGKYRDSIFNFSFVGFVGARRPEAVIAVRIAEAKPDILGQGELALEVTSYELFRRIARAAIRHLDIEPSSDPDAGYPIPLSQADLVLTPRRYEQHLRDGRQPHAQEPTTDGARERGARPDRSDRDDGSTLDLAATDQARAGRSGTEEPPPDGQGTASRTDRRAADAPDAPDG